MTKNILFLGPTESPLFNWLKSKIFCIATDQKISPNIITNNQIDLIVSYGYRHILKDEILRIKGLRAINLHISLLPWNRGADPNFWSFIENTPKGVTIHEIDQGIDTGKILLQKEVTFNEEIETLESTYTTLQNEIQKLFIAHFEDIMSNSLIPKSQIGNGTFHTLKDKKNFFEQLSDGWNTRIVDIRSRYNQFCSITNAL